MRKTVYISLEDFPLKDEPEDAVSSSSSETGTHGRRQPTSRPGSGQGDYLRRYSSEDILGLATSRHENGSTPLTSSLSRRSSSSAAFPSSNGHTVSNSPFMSKDLPTTNSFGNRQVMPESLLKSRERPPSTPLGNGNSMSESLFRSRDQMPSRPLAVEAERSVRLKDSQAPQGFARSDVQGRVEMSLGRSLVHDSRNRPASPMMSERYIQRTVLPTREEEDARRDVEIQRILARRAERRRSEKLESLLRIEPTVSAASKERPSSSSKVTFGGRPTVFSSSALRDRELRSISRGFTEL